MRLLELEAFVLNVADQILGGRVPEDSRLELKADWPTDAGKAARRLAGHANAALGEPIVWIVGIDESRGVMGVDSIETKDWLEKVFAWFEGVRPAVVDLVVRVGERTVVALLFETDRAPFVVKNPAFGVEKTPISHEVPWREATQVRSARREDLIRLLGELIDLPEVEVLGATLNVATASERGNDNLSARVNIYVTPRGKSAIVIPFHRCRVTVNNHTALPISSAAPYSRFLRFGDQTDSRPVSHTVHVADNEVIFDGPGRVVFQVSCRTTEQFDWGPTLDMRLTLAIAGSDRLLDLTLVLNEAGGDGANYRNWQYGDG